MKSSGNKKRNNTISRELYNYFKTNPDLSKNSFGTTDTDPSIEKKNVQGESLDLWKSMVFGNVVCSCVTCRSKKSKCDGVRPKCGTCTSFDRTCGYVESFNAGSELKNIDSLHTKILNLNKTIRSIKYLENLKKKYREQRSLNKIKTSATKKKIIIDNEYEDIDYEPLDSILNESMDSLSSGIESLVITSGLEIGSLDVEDELLIEIKKKISESSLMGNVLSRKYLLLRVKNKSVPEYMKYSILSYGVKLLDNHIVFKDHLYMCGSIYAKKALDLILSENAKISADKVFSLVILATHFMGLGNIFLSTRLTALAIKTSLTLRMNMLDISKPKWYVSSDEWMESEYKRRVWWLVYATSVVSSFMSGVAPWIQNQDICVNLPTHDFFYSGKVENIELSMERLNTNPKGTPIDKNDIFCMFVKSYIELGTVTRFINRYKLTRNENSYEYMKNFDYINKRLDSFETLYKSFFGDTPWEKLDINARKKSLKHISSENDYLIFDCSYTYRIARLLLHRIRIPFSSLTHADLKKSKESKIICLEMALQIASLIRYSSENFPKSYGSAFFCHSAMCTGSILVNVLRLNDHPNHKQIKKSYSIVLSSFKKFGTMSAFSTFIFNRLRVNYGLFLKSVMVNNKYVDLFPELKINSISPMDIYPWFVPAGSSGNAFGCCSVTKDSPIYKHAFIENWIDPDVILLRKSNNSIMTENNLKVEDLILFKNNTQSPTGSSRVASETVTKRYNLKNNFSNPNLESANHNFRISRPRFRNTNLKNLDKGIVLDKSNFEHKNIQDQLNPGFSILRHEIIDPQFQNLSNQSFVFIDERHKNFNRINFDHQDNEHTNQYSSSISTPVGYGNSDSTESTQFKSMPTLFPLEDEINHLKKHKNN
ncbi:hypothetical protein AYI69_g6320 [Smittium culicis]|uniref:Zn(2)-C6 fungal-type domain-containing protein n=1 Tax=Smittium culicis TaxID=133412 RepID=A0A1R1XZX0_9FUNG|nr:hypothetical protein AYI69_g6320 [Smittium culicis]